MEHFKEQKDLHILRNPIQYSTPTFIQTDLTANINLSTNPLFKIVTRNIFEISYVYLFLLYVVPKIFRVNILQRVDVMLPVTHSDWEKYIFLSISLEFLKFLMLYVSNTFNS
jgi:hypothetical protein